jgi:hypothetical protein
VRNARGSTHVRACDRLAVIQGTLSSVASGLSADVSLSELVQLLACGHSTAICVVLLPANCSVASQSLLSKSVRLENKLVKKRDSSDGQQKVSDSYWQKSESGHHHSWPMSENCQRRTRPLDEHSNDPKPDAIPKLSTLQECDDVRHRTYRSRSRIQVFH